MSAWSDAVAALSPYGWWKLGETSGTAAADASGNAHPGVYSTTASITYSVSSLIPGDDGTGVTFTATGPTMNVTGLSYPSVGVTYAQTFKSATDQTGTWFRHAGTTNLLSIQASIAQAQIASSGGLQIVNFPSYDPSVLFDGNAHLIVWVVRATSTELWVDGAMVSSVAHAAAGPATLTQISNKGGFSGPTGSYDDLVLWTSALSSTQIGDLYTGWAGAAAPAGYSAEVLADNPLAYWRQADAASGATMADSSSNARNGSWASAASSASSLLIGDTNAASAHTGATNKYGFVPSASWMSPLTAVTLEAWFKTSSSGLQAIIGKTEAGGFGLSTAGSYRIFINDGALTFNVFDSSFQPMFTLTAGSGLANNAAHHVVGTWDGTTARLYVDGAQVGSTAASGTMAPVGTVDLYVGIMGTNFPFNGTLDEAAIYGTALSAARVADHYNVGTGAGAAAEITLAGQVGAVTAAVTADVAVDTTIAGHVGPVTVAVSVDALADVTLAGQVGPVLADVSVEAVPSEVDVTLAGQVGPVTAAFTVDAPIDVALTGQLGAVTADVQAEITAPTPVLTVDTANRVNGRSRSGLASVRFEPSVVLPPSPEPEHERHVGAVVFSTPTIVGAQPVYTVSAATKKRTRHRILVGGKDVSFYRDIATPEPGYGLAEPLLWDRCTIDFPQVAAAFESPGKGQLRWCRKGAPVVLQRVTAAGEIVSIDYRGVVIGHDISGKNLKVEVGGHASGRAALRYKPLPIFKDTLDLGRLAWAAIRDMGLRFEPRMGPKTGMKQALWGGMWHGEYIDELSSRAQQRNGTQWTIMPSDAGVYRMQPKDRETINFTVFTDDKRAVPNLRSDASEEPNRIFASGVTPRGQRVRFGVYPGLKPSKPAPYPFTDNRAFGFGTTDADTDTGDGITVMLRTLWGMGYLSLEDADPDGGFDADARGAVEALQDDAGIHDGPLGYLDKGAMDPETWAALFDFDVTGFNIRGARVEPAAQAPRTRRYRRSASGRIMGKNPRFDRHALIVDRPLEFGFGHTRHQMREWSAAEIARGEDNWVGTLDITTGGVLHGEVAPGTVIGGDDIMDVRAIKPGMNAWLPLFAGGILVHVSAVEISYDGNGIPQAKLYVDTQARDAMQVWDVIRRNRESREDPARRRKGNRASTELKDSITEWDEVGGVVYDDVDLQPGWNVIPVVAGQEGSVSRIRVLIQDVTGEGGEVAIQGREFAVAVFGKKVTPARLRHLIGNPLAASPDSTAEPVEDDVDPPEADPEADGADPAPAASANRPWWERKKIADALRNLELLHSAGTKEEPCGYSPGKKSNGGTKTGLYRRDASFSYRTHGEPVLYLAVWVWGERTLSSGRVMWNQLESGA